MASRERSQSVDAVSFESCFENTHVEGKVRRPVAAPVARGGLEESLADLQVATGEGVEAPGGLLGPLDEENPPVGALEQDVDADGRDAPEDVLGDAPREARRARRRPQEFLVAVEEAQVAPVVAHLVRLGPRLVGGVVRVLELEGPRRHVARDEPKVGEEAQQDGHDDQRAAALAPLLPRVVGVLLPPPVEVRRHHSAAEAWLAAGSPALRGAQTLGAKRETATAAAARPVARTAGGRSSRRRFGRPAGLPVRVPPRACGAPCRSSRGRTWATT